MQLKEKSIKSFILGALAFSLVSCNSEQEAAFGTYVTVEKNSVQRLWAQVNNNVYPAGTSVALHEDSTFTQTNCGNVYKGTWRLNNDSITFMPTSNEWSSDSIAEILGRQPRLGAASFKAYFSGKKITWSETVLLDGESYKAIIELEKEAGN